MEARVSNMNCRIVKHAGDAPDHQNISFCGCSIAGLKLRDPVLAKRPRRIENDLAPGESRYLSPCLANQAGIVIVLADSSEYQNPCGWG